MTDLLTYDDDDVMRLKDGATTAQALVRRTPRAALEERRFGEWSAIDALSHVVALAEVTRERVQRCRAERDPAIQSVPDGAMLEERDPIALARRLQEAHRSIVELMMEPGLAERGAVHSQYGRVTAGHLAAYHARHADEHVSELSRAFAPA